ncbi:DDE_3 domain-containing protein [Trichonephila clavipes]|nr:DDE_3 domain-containing protein [Trichonephila clavipes]
MIMRPHRARIVEEYLEDHGLERMEWPARSPDLNPIEHLLGLSWQRGCCFKSSSRSLHELKQGLLCLVFASYSGVRQFNKQHGEIDAANAFKLGVDTFLIRTHFCIVFMPFYHITL